MTLRYSARVNRFRLACLCAALACGAPTDSKIAVLPTLKTAETTSARTLMASHAFLEPPDSANPGSAATRNAWLKKGYGDTTEGPGESQLPLAPPGVTVPARGANPKLLVRFVHLPDTQLVDDESPNRLANFDTPSATAGAIRPQDGSQCRVLNAAVRTINGLHKKTPIQFVLTGGDNADSAQQNELEWFMQIMSGAPSVKCDSGDVNDPVEGPNNDGKDAFKAEGLAMPWKWVTGNHDVLIVGTTPVTDDVRAQAVGTSAPTGTRDYSRPGAPIFNGPVVPDPKRLPLRRAEVMALVAADKDGHGLGEAQKASGKAFYSFDIEGTPLRFIAIDTCNEFGDSEGMMHRPDMNGVLKQLLDQAKADHKAVVLASHHATDSLSDGSGFGGTKQADAVTVTEWRNFLGSYDNIVFYMVGHTHENRVRYVDPPAAGSHRFWEVMTSSLADFPHQFRVVELWDDDNGWLRLSSQVANFSTENDDVSAEARKLGVADAVAGWAHNGSGTTADRNVELSIQKPQ